MQKKEEIWKSKLGVVLAVSGSAIGLANFLRFPGLAAQYGGGAFMLVYFFSFLIIGLPIAWAEWTMGRCAGAHGYNSSSGILHFILKRPCAKYFGVIGVAIPIVVYMYYIVIEAWCLGYMLSFLKGVEHFNSPEKVNQFFTQFAGTDKNGFSVYLGFDSLGLLIITVFIINFIFIYRGIAKGIEFLCKYAMPVLFVIALLVLARTLTLGTPNPSLPNNNIYNGLGYMWNPQKVVLQKKINNKWQTTARLIGEEKIENMQDQVEGEPRVRIKTISIWEDLQNPQLWLAATGQIFFSLSIGFGTIITYASYLKRKDDIVLSSLTAACTNEFAEICIGGLLTIPAGIAFLGIAGITGQNAFGLGFNVLPIVFAKIPFGAFFGFVFFFLLFIAAITSSVSMLQPGIAFLEEALKIGRKLSVILLGIITGAGSLFVFYFSKDLKALDTLDFWVGTFLIFIFSTILIIIFSWFFGIKRGWKEAHYGAHIHIPRIFKYIMKYISPLYLIIIFSMWLLVNVLGYNFKTDILTYSPYIKDLFIKPNYVSIATIAIILVTMLILVFIIRKSKTYKSHLSQSSKIKKERGDR